MILALLCLAFFWPLRSFVDVYDLLLVSLDITTQVRKGLKPPEFLNKIFQKRPQCAMETLGSFAMNEVLESITENILESCQKSQRKR